MWSGFPEPGSIFFEDDPQNQKLADKYGIVVSTSHHEPMQRNMSEWRLSNNGNWKWDDNKTAIASFMRQGAERAYPYESILTLGMRGESDNEIDTTDPRSTLTDVIRTQRDIIKRVYGKPDGVNRVYNHLCFCISRRPFVNPSQRLWLYTKKCCSITKKASKYPATSPYCLRTITLATFGACRPLRRDNAQEE